MLIVSDFTGDYKDGYNTSLNIEQYSSEDSDTVFFYGIQCGIDKILEIRRSIFCSHLEQKLGVLGIPVKVLGYVIGRDGEGENSAVHVPVTHHF